MANLFPDISTLPAQFAALLDLQKQILAELKTANKPEEFQSPGADHKSIFFKITPTQFYTTSVQLRIRAILICHADAPSTPTEIAILSGENQQLFIVAVDSNLPVFMRWDDDEAMEISRGLRLGMTSTAGSGAQYAYIWAMSK